MVGHEPPDGGRQRPGHGDASTTARSCSATARCRRRSRRSSDRTPSATRPGPASAARSRARSARTATRSPPFACDDGPFGKGAGGELRYRVTVPRASRETRVVRGRRPTPRSDLARARARATPARRCAPRSRSRDAARRAARASTCPATAASRTRSTGASRTSPTSRRPRATCRSASSTRARPTRAPIGTVARATFIGAGYPDYPWLFATDGEYTAFAAVALGQFEAIKAHLRALRDVSDILNGRSGKVAHEIVTDGSVYFGANADAGNTDESVKFPSAVALVWRWTGDNRFLNDLYDFSDAQPALRRRQPRRRQGRLARGPRATSSATAWARRSSTTPST